MRFLVFSDVHSNLTALETVLDSAAGRYERAICLGDLVGYGPDPNEVINRVREVATAVVRGNHDKAACGITELEDFNPVAGMALAWTRSQVTSESLAYLRNLPAGPLEQDGLTLVHGSLLDEDEYVFSPLQAYDSLLAATKKLTLFGHTHYQSGFSYRDGEIDATYVRPGERASFAGLQLEDGMHYMLNPGSVGQPRDGDPRAAFALVDTVSDKVEFWRVPYDIGAVQKRMTDADDPEPLVSRLMWGR